MGHGDYTVNSLINPGSERSLSGVQNVSFEKGMVRTRIQKREFVGYLQAPGFSSGAGSPFNVTTFRVNPGNTALFPYLAWGFPQTFKRWRPLGLAFELISTSTDYSTAVNLGVMGLSVDYDSHDSQFTSMTQALQAVGAVSGKVSQNQLIGVECDPSERAVEWLYVRNGAVNSNINGAGADVNLYDLCTVSFFTEGLSNAAGGKVAEVWATYDLEFEYPYPNAGVGGSQNTSFILYTTSADAAHPFGTNWRTRGSFPTQIVSVAPAGQPGVQVNIPSWVSGVFQLTYLCEWGGGEDLGMAAPIVVLGAGVTEHNSLGMPRFSAYCTLPPPALGHGALNHGVATVMFLDIQAAPIGGNEWANWLQILIPAGTPGWGNYAYFTLNAIDAALGDKATPYWIDTDPWRVTHDV
jgi:hypothetical protein